MTKNTASHNTMNALFRYLLSLSRVRRAGGSGNRVASYIIAILATLVTLLIYYALGVAIEGRLSAILFVLPIIISAYLGGVGPGLISTLISAAYLAFFIIPPTYSFAIEERLNLSQLIILMTNGALVSLLIEVLHRSRVYAEERTNDFLAANKKLEEEIIERKKAEEALKEQGSRLKSIFRVAPVGIGLAHNRHLADVNNTLCTMTGYSRNELIGKSARILYPSDEEFEYVGTEKYRQIKEKGTGTVETRWLRKDGSPIHIILSSTPLDWKELAKGVTFTALDISDRTRAEKKLLMSLKEKEILLHEIHHRVKNNLQVISSLILLQSANISDKQSLDLLQECQNRIKAMALVHEELYRAKDFISFDFSSYITGLVSSLFESYAADKNRVALEIAADNILLDIDMAIPCGLIINELVSNSLKHAFPNGSSGLIRVNARALAENTVSVSVSDNGIGLPAALEPGGSETLGLQLVYMLADQLHGVVTVLRNKGTEFRISFENGLSTEPPAEYTEKQS